MSLQITETRTKVERTKRTLSAPSNFGMFSSAGNARLRGYANTLLKQVEQGKDWRKAVKSYLVKYHRTCGDKRFGEASDTAVREVVRGFAEDVIKAVNGEFGAFDIETQLNDEAASKVWNERQ